MDRSRVAEWILSLALPAERAAAVTGDFLEEAPVRGGFWFWSSVVRTVASGVWMDIREAPGELILLGVRGFFTNLLASGWYSLCFGFLTLPVLLLKAWIGDGTQSVIILALGTWFAARRTGRLLAQRAPDRKLAACVVFFVVGGQLIPLAIGIVVGYFWGGGIESMPQFLSWTDGVLCGGLVYGALKGDGRKPVAQG